MLIPQREVVGRVFYRNRQRPDRARRVGSSCPTRHFTDALATSENSVAILQAVEGFAGLSRHLFHAFRHCRHQD